MNVTGRDLSVIIAVYNGEPFIAQAVKSIRRQKDDVGEIIVVDDGSTDGTGAVARSLDGVRYVQQPNQGPAAARNHGLRLSRGSLLCFLDADDLWVDDKLEVQLPLLAENPQLEIVIGYSQRVVIPRWDGTQPVYEPIGNPVFYLHLGSALMRRSVFDKVGLFDEQLAVTAADRSTAAVGEELDWYLRAKELGIRMQFHKEVMQFCLRHERNVTLRRDLTNEYLVRMFKRSLDRRRVESTNVARRLEDWRHEAQFLPEARGLRWPETDT